MMENGFEMSFFRAPITNKVPQQTVTLAQVAQAVKSTWLKPQTAHLRLINDEAEARRYKGWQFPYVTPAGVFSYCNDASLQRYSGVLCMDLDHLEDVTGLKSRLIADQNFRTLMAFRSPLGMGLKWFLEIDLSLCGYGQWFDGVRNYLMQTYGLSTRQADASVRNVSKACYLCHDPEVYVNLTTDK